MNDDLQKALAEILNKSTKGVEASVGFLQRELPDVIQQLLIWHGVKSAIFFVISMLATVLMAWGTKRIWVWARAEDDGSEPLVVFPAFLVGVSFLFCVNQLDWLQIMVAPKLYLIEYAASLAK